MVDAKFIVSAIALLVRNLQLNFSIFCLRPVKIQLVTVQIQHTVGNQRTPAQNRGQSRIVGQLNPPVIVFGQFPVSNPNVI